MASRVAVVGAGIVGCVIARELVSRAPEASVIVLDRDAVGCGASRRSAGLHIPRGCTTRLRRMTEYSQDYYEKLKISRPSLPIHPLRLSVVAAEDARRRIEETYLDRASLIREDAAPSKFVRLPERTGSWRANGCQHADVYALVQAIACELRQRISLREGIRVVAIDSVAGRVVLNLGTRDTLTVDRLVLAPGPWLDDPAFSALVAPLGSRVKKIVALHVEQRPSERDQAIVFQNEDAFLLPLRQRGHWLFSYTCQEWDVSPDEIVGELSHRDIEEAREILGRYAPALVDRCDSGRVFCDAYSDSGEPLVQALGGDERIVFAGAAGGCGYRLAPAIAAEVADLLDTPLRS